VARASSTEGIPERFASHRYVKVESLIEDGLCRMLYDYIRQREAVAKPSSGEEQEGAVELGSDQVMEHVLGGVQPRVEQLSGLKLVPTYSFFRIYRQGNVLKRHRDRPACEVSVSLNLGPPLDKPWPLWIKGPLGESAVALAPGDAVLYRGIECEHWRERFEGDLLAQVFLHYVDQDGPCTDWKFDKRPSLAT
jgi:hypothetical protein